jgi:hypothetical protein
MPEPIAPDSTSASVTSAAPVSTSEPARTSTADIAADVIADLDGGGTDNTPPASSVVTTTADAVADPDDFDTIPPTTHNIPLPRVKKMRTKDQQKLLTTLAKELGMTPAEGAELRLEDVVGTIKEHGTKRTTYETRLQQVDAVEKLITENPEKFMQIIGEINPAYKEFARKEAAAAIAAQTPVEDPEPQPDYDLGDGKKTYTLEGLKKRDEWKERQLMKKIEAQLGERFKPVEDRFKAEKEREEYDRWYADATARVTQRLEKARKWPKFADHEADILKAMQADPSVSLEDAYFQAAGPDLAGERTRVRKEVLTEIEKQPKTSSVPVSPTTPKVDDKPKSTADIAREIMASMGAS